MTKENFLIAYVNVQRLKFRTVIICDSFEKNALSNNSIRTLGKIIINAGSFTRVKHTINKI